MARNQTLYRPAEFGPGLYGICVSYPHIKGRKAGCERIWLGWTVDGELAVYHSEEKRDLKLAELQSIQGCSFAHELDQVIQRVAKSQYKFAALVGISQSMITKLVNRTTASPGSYRKVLEFFSKDSDTIQGAERLDALERLTRALIEDRAKECGVPDQITITVAKRTRPS